MRKLDREVLAEEPMQFGLRLLQRKQCRMSLLHGRRLWIVRVAPCGRGQHDVKAECEIAHAAQGAAKRGDGCYLHGWWLEDVHRPSRIHSQLPVGAEGADLLARSRTRSFRSPRF